MAKDDMAMVTENDGGATGEKGGVVLSEEQLRRRRLRSFAIGLAVFLFMALIYAVTIIRLGGGAGHSPS